MAPRASAYFSVHSAIGNTSPYLYDARPTESVQRNGKGLLNPVNDAVVKPDSAETTTAKTHSVDRCGLTEEASELTNERIAVLHQADIDEIHRLWIILTQSGNQ